MLRLPVAPGEPLSIVPYCPLNRNPVPSDKLNPADKRRMAEPWGDMGDEILSPPSFNEVFHHEREKSQHSTKRKRKQIIGVEVAQRGKDFRHLPVESHLRRQGLRISRLFQFLQKELEALDWVNRMHGPLQWKVDIVLLDEDQSLANQQLTVFERQITYRHEKSCQVYRLRKVLADSSVHPF